MWRLTAGLLTGLVTLATQAATAQIVVSGGDSSRPMVTASGSATIELSPERLRGNFKSHAQGATLPEALAVLRQQTEKDKALLATLDAEPDSIRTGLPKVQSASAAARQQQLREMLMENGMMFGGAIVLEEEAVAVEPGGEAGEPEPQKVTVTAKISAEWKLKSQGVEELLILQHDLAETLKRKDAGAFLQTQGLTLEQLNEMADQMGADPWGMGMEQVYTGAKFKFVARIPPQRRKLALKQAFRKAQESAEEVAASAGRSLGPLLTVSVTDPTEYIMAGYGYGQQNKLNRDRQNEISGPSPGPLKRVFTTNVSFQLADE